MTIATILDPANGKGSEVQELEMLTGSGELMQYSFADGTEPNSMEIQSYAGGTKRVKKVNAKSGPTLVDKYRTKVSQKGPSIGTKAKGLVGSGKVSGILAALNPQGGAPMTQPLPPPPPAKTPMSTGMKVGIAVGIAAVVGIIIYVVVKKKKK